ncbi:hypothetical protein H2200_012211 [Cladophialophora chaetospira]|uniref:HMA domain-containing protein n=1 Tax=Cladophialophora chaetospira TaxID=386627 RepID=A0AA38WYD5_9EURO|nr:hypothetical protein H2200_012211 [Cladophialophora chaetospira]
MACCVFTAYVMSRIIKACELFDLRILEVKYNDSDSDFSSAPSFQPVYGQQSNTTSRTAAAHTGKAGQQQPSEDQPWTTTRLLVTGMICSACVSTITHALTSHPAVLRANISLPLSRATIMFNATNASTEDLISIIEDVGYGAEALVTGYGGSGAQNLRLVRREEELQALKIAFNGAAKWATAIATFDWARYIAEGTHLAGALDPMLQLSALVVAVSVQATHGRWIHHNAWSSCYARGRFQLPNLTMDTLLSLSLALSVSLSLFNIGLHGLAGPQTKTYFSTASFLTVVISGGRYLDVTLKRQGAASFARLFGLQQELDLGTVIVEQKVRVDQEEVNKPIETVLTQCPMNLLTPLDVYHIPAGVVIPCDSYVLRGQSLIDEANMTGESRPVRKSVGDLLMSGTRNISASVVAVVLKEQAQSSLEKLVDSIEEATEMKYTGASSGEELMPAVVQIVTRHFVPVVLVLALVDFILILGSPTCYLPLTDRTNVACERAMAILAAACPCAIGLANPSAIMAGIDAAYTQGVLLPGGANALETLSRLTHLVLDKTGTLTEGRLKTSKALFAEPFRSDARKRQLCYNVLSAAERDEAQAHPMGRAVFQWCVRQLQESSHLQQAICEPGASPARNISKVTGKGVFAEVQDHNDIWHVVHIGSERFLSEHHISVAPDTATQLAGLQARAQVHFALDGKYAGTFVLQDTIRQNAPAVIQSLRSLGLNLTMLTGDTVVEAHRVSSQLQIPVLAARSLPQEKRDLVVSLRESSVEGRTNNVVAMLGDGLNDAPAQAAADVGILFSLSPLSSRSSNSTSSLALGTSAADVIVMTADLTAVPKLISIARKTMLQARVNTYWAILYNTVAIALAMGVGEPFGLKSPDASSAGMMMAFSSITVLGMSLQLRQRLN